MQRRITYGKTFGAVEYTLDAHKNEVLNLLLLQKKKNELQIKQKEQYTSFDDLINALENQKHLFLIVNNANVLSKEIDTIDENTERIVLTTFPNINLTDFYYEILTTKNKSFIAISRKSEVDSIIEDYQKKGVSIVGFSLGNIGVQNILPFSDYNQLATSNAMISIEDKQIQSIEKKDISNTSYTINDLELSNNDVIPLSGILSYYLGNSLLKGLEEKKRVLQKEFQQKRTFINLLYGMLGFLLTILLVNFLFFSSYRSDINKLTSEVQLNEVYKKQLLQLNEQVTQKEQLLKGLQSVSNSKVSMYLDEIATEIPNTILLSELSYQPLKKRIKKDKQIQLDKQYLKIAGTSKKEVDFNNFIQVLEQKEWIDAVTILSYGKSNTTNSEFGVLLKLKDE